MSYHEPAYMDKLTGMKCVPCEGGVEPMTRAQFSHYLGQVPAWAVAADEKSISNEFTFKNFLRAMAFVNAVAYLAEQEGHHPDLLVHGWSKVRLTHATHAIGGLSINDFVLAAKVDSLAPASDI